jgi:3-vinyl bacteriochlorophyllide hydratase
MDQPRQARGPKRAPLYSPEERRRRDATAWTLVQGVLAPVQFLVFLVSLGLVLRYLATGEGERRPSLSVVVKTVLYTDHDHRLHLGKGRLRPLPVRPAFFWEDVFSMLVLALHTAYLWAWFTHKLGPRELMLLALAAYASLRDQRHAVRAEAARRAAAGRTEALRAPRGRSPDMSAVIPIKAAAAHGCDDAPCCASAASARCSAA